MGSSGAFAVVQYIGSLPVGPPVRATAWMCEAAPMGQRRRGVAIAWPIATAADGDADIVWLMCDTESLCESLMAFETRHPPWRNIGES